MDSSQIVQITCTTTGCKCRSWAEIEAVKGLIHRLIPKYTELFQLELLDQPGNQSIYLSLKFSYCYDILIFLYLVLSILIYRIK